MESGLKVKVASATYFPPTERGVNSPDRKVGEGAPPGEEEGAGCRGESLMAKMLQVEQKKRRLRSREAA